MLNKEQQQAVQELKSPLLVVAGPGTGKTTVITHKILHLLEKSDYSSENILALTFTQKAAEEMSERVQEESKKDFLAKTFHSFALELIEEYQREIPELDQDFLLLDENSQLLFFIENIYSFNLKSVELKNNQRFIVNLQPQKS